MHACTLYSISFADKRLLTTENSTGVCGHVGVTMWVCLCVYSTGEPLRFAGPMTSIQSGSSHFQRGSRNSASSQTGGGMASRENSSRRLRPFHAVSGLEKHAAGGLVATAAAAAAAAAGYAPPNRVRLVCMSHESLLPFPHGAPAHYAQHLQPRPQKGRKKRRWRAWGRVCACVCLCVCVCVGAPYGGPRARAQACSRHT